jgi:Helix-turn-helix domain
MGAYKYNWISLAFLVLTWRISLCRLRMIRVKTDLLTTKQAGEVLGVTQERVRQFVRQGRISVVLRTPIVLIAREELEQFERRPRARTGRPKKSL